MTTDLAIITPQTTDVVQAELEQISGQLPAILQAASQKTLARMEGEQDNGWQGVAQALGVA